MTDERTPSPTAEDQPSSKYSTDLSVLPDRNDVYTNKDYWNQRYAKEKSDIHFDWCLRSDTLLPIMSVSPENRTQPNRAHTPALPYPHLSGASSSPQNQVGSSCSDVETRSYRKRCARFLVSQEVREEKADQTWSFNDRYDEGWTNIVNVDYSTPLIEQMIEKHSVSRPEMSWHQMDIRALEFEDNSFDVAIDKGPWTVCFLLSHRQFELIIFSSRSSTATME